MSTETAAPVEHDDHGHADGHAHPTDKLFVQIFVILAVITAIEVAWSYFPFWEDAEGMTKVAENGGLIIMMGIKFYIVASVFMHLKFDKKILTGLFYAGLFLAIGVYIAALFTFGIFL